MGMEVDRWKGLTDLWGQEEGESNHRGKDMFKKCLRVWQIFAESKCVVSHSAHLQRVHFVFPEIQEACLVAHPHNRTVSQAVGLKQGICQLIRSGSAEILNTEFAVVA